jgi:hypothetical protein
MCLPVYVLEPGVLRKLCCDCANDWLVQEVETINADADEHLLIRIETVECFNDPMQHTPQRITPQILHVVRHCEKQCLHPALTGLLFHIQQFFLENPLDRFLPQNICFRKKEERK